MLGCPVCLPTMSIPCGATAHPVSSNSFLLCHPGWVFLSCHLLASLGCFLWVGACPWDSFPAGSHLSCECMDRLHPNNQLFPGAVFFKLPTHPPVSPGALCTSPFCLTNQQANPLVLLRSGWCFCIVVSALSAAELAAKPLE